MNVVSTKVKRSNKDKAFVLFVCEVNRQRVEVSYVSSPPYKDNPLPVRTQLPNRPSTPIKHNMSYNTRSLRPLNTSTGATKRPRRPEKPGTADAGDLEKLPLEIRQMIYKFTLADSDVVKIESHQPRNNQEFVFNGVEITRPPRLEAAPFKHRRRSKRRGQEWIGGKWVEIPNKNALLQVNKQILAETRPVLYGDNDFEFQTTRALEAFVTQIGKANRQFLRTIDLIRPKTERWVHRTNKGIAAQARAMDLLKGAKNIRTIRIDCMPQLAKCSLFLWEHEVDWEILELHVDACDPVLETLKDHFSHGNINGSVLDVLSIKSAVEDSDFHLDRDDCIPGRYLCHWCEDNRQRLARSRALLKIMVIGALEIEAPEALQELIKDFENNGGYWPEFVDNTWITQFQILKEKTPTLEAE